MLTLLAPVPVGRARPSNSFLNLPAEIRIMIYRQCLISQRGILIPDKKPSNLMPSLHPPDRIPARKLKASDSCIDANQSCRCGLCLTYRASTIQIFLLSTNKQIHGEAAAIFYGENVFRFMLGPVERDYRYYSLGLNKVKDNLSCVSPIYLKMIMHIEVKIRISCSRVGGRQMYKDYRGRIEDFVARFGGVYDCLKSVQVTFNRPFYRDFDAKSASTICIRNRQNLLEPLANIHKAGMDINVSGVTPDFEARMVAAMTSEMSVFTPKTEMYGFRTARDSRGKLLQQRYKLGEYYNSTFSWDEKVLWSHVVRAENDSPSHRCCEPCTTRDHFR